MIELQKFLLEKELDLGSKDDSLCSLKDLYSINYKMHSVYPELVLFKYSQIESPMSEKVVQQARGIILNSNDWSVIARPYDKFFNLEEPNAANINWDSANILEKLDGSLISLYYYNGEWHCSTSGTPCAFGEVHGFNFSFKELFWMVWKELNYNLPSPEDQDKTFMFELMTPYNRIVVPHKENKIVIHGVRNLNGVEYSPIEYSEKYGWSCVKYFPFNSKEEVLEELCNINGMECEGFVVADSDFNRIKLKNLDYVRFSRLKSGFNIRSIIEIVRENEQDEFLSYFPEYSEYYEKVKVIYDALLKEAEELYNKHKDIEDQKEFALSVKDERTGWASFALRKNKDLTCREVFKQVNINKFEQILGVENIKISNL